MIDPSPKYNSLLGAIYGLVSTFIAMLARLIDVESVLTAGLVAFTGATVGFFTKLFWNKIVKTKNKNKNG